MMNCPYLILDQSPTCDANNAYPPSRFQVQEYCKSKRKRYAICPFFAFHSSEKKMMVKPK